MRIPTSASHSNAPDIVIENVEDRSLETPMATEEERRPRKHRRPSTYRYWHHSSIKDPATNGKEAIHGIEERARICPIGKTFYRCANGYQGCCAHDPCNPGDSCRDDQKTNTPKESTQTATPTKESATRLTTDRPIRTRTRTRHPQTITHSSHHSTATSSILSATETSKSSSTSGSAPVVTGTPPACPGGNGTHYSDSSKVEYEIRCGIENTFTSYNGLYVSLGGYGECFSACSKTDQCAGFTFVGKEAGNCYLKSQMPDKDYIQHEGNNYITCSKLNPPHNKGDGVKTSPKKAGIIAGAVIGSVILLLLLWLLARFFIRRHRKKVNAKRATITHVIQGPIEMQPYRPPNHERQGSTSHDLYSPSGGITQRSMNAATEGYDQMRNKISGNLDGYEQIEQVSPKATGVAGAVRPESGFIPVMLPSSVYQPAKPSKKLPTVQRWGSRSSKARSARFQEQLDEQQSSIDSPTLGSQAGSSRSMASDVRRNQYLSSAHKSSGYKLSP